MDQQQVKFKVKIKAKPEVKTPKVKIITDSCADLSDELLRRYNIDYVKMSTILNGIKSPALLTWNAKGAHSLYETIRSGKQVTTAPVSVDEFTRVFTLYLDAGYDIVYIGCSIKQSKSVPVGHTVSRKLLKDYPDAKIYCIDSLNACIGEGILAIEASKMAAAGKNADEIAASIITMRNNVNEYATVHTLEYLRRARRVSASSAFFGNLMGVKPILIADAAGAQAGYKRVKGRENSLNEIVRLMKETIINPEEQTIYLAHADCPQQDIDYLVNRVKAEIPCKEIYTWFIGPIIGASVGPDAIGIWALGEEVTFLG